MENSIGISSLTFEQFPTLIKALENFVISLPTIKPTFIVDVEQELTDLKNEQYEVANKNIMT